MPCGPSRISLKKLNSATQMMGDTSTPPTGGIARRVGPSTGSVGLNASDHGSFPPSSCSALARSAQLLQSEVYFVRLYAGEHTEPGQRPSSLQGSTS